MDTPMQAKMMHIQISSENGVKKLKTPLLFGAGRFIMMETPTVMKGLVKSITSSLSDVIVSGATAISASCIQ